MFAIFLTSGLFLGWSLGANDAANVRDRRRHPDDQLPEGRNLLRDFRHLRGRHQAGRAQRKPWGIGRRERHRRRLRRRRWPRPLPSTGLRFSGYPVSTTQEIVGAIIGWDLFSGLLIDFGALEKIVLSWFISPILAAIFSALLYKVTAFGIKYARIHMFSLDALTRSGSASGGHRRSLLLGANNISNVVGIFVPLSPSFRISLFRVVQPPERAAALSRWAASPSPWGPSRMGRRLC